MEVPSRYGLVHPVLSEHPRRGETAHFVWNRRDHLNLPWSRHGQLARQCRLIAYPSRLIRIGLRTLIPLVLYQWYLP